MVRGDDGDDAPPRRPGRRSLATGCVRQNSSPGKPLLVVISSRPAVGHRLERSRFTGLSALQMFRLVSRLGGSGRLREGLAQTMGGRCGTGATLKTFYVVAALAPRRSLAPLGRRVDSVLFEDVADRSAPDSMANVLECPLDSRVAPAWVLSRHSDGQFRDDFHDPWSARGSSFVGPLLGNELPVPTKDGVGSDEGSDLGQGSSSNGLPAYGKPATLIVGQPESFPSKLLLQDPILFSEIFDDSILLATDPAGQGGN